MIGKRRRNGNPSGVHKGTRLGDLLVGITVDLGNLDLDAVDDELVGPICVGLHCENRIESPRRLACARADGDLFCEVGEPLVRAGMDYISLQNFARAEPNLTGRSRILRQAGAVMRPNRRVRNHENDTRFAG